ncbi:MAG: tyrosine-type recombinase/integrase, partial [Bradyrhizobium canariense]
TSAGTRIKTAFKAACRRAGVVDFHPHDCRHTFATWHSQQNRDIGGLMRLGGWKSERMVMRYAHVNVGELQHTINKLPGGYAGDGDKRETKKL